MIVALTLSRKQVLIFHANGPLGDNFLEMSKPTLWQKQLKIINMSSAESGILKATHSSKIDILLSKNGLIN